MTHVIPVALRVVKDDAAQKSGIYVAEFPMVSIDQFNEFEVAMHKQLDGSAHMNQIPITNDGLYFLYPAVKGIG